MTVRALRQLALAAALPMLLVACASLSPATVPSLPHAPTSAGYHRDIELGGRLSVRYQAGDKEEALHGSFTWSQTTSDTTVTLLSPLGQTIAVIRSMPSGATLEQGGQPPRSATDVDTLTADTLGWPLPVSGLREWLQGYAVDRNGRSVTTSQQTPEVLTSDGWRISYPAWTEDGTVPPQNRPRRIDLVRHTPQAGDVSIRIVIDSWQAH